ncbi:MAG: nucleotide exchange factor GrpE [Crocinitomicaceae bacterium]|nr:nucleotide exchange factor GrpE [Crocinitomicaceae bacterium]
MKTKKKTAKSTKNTNTEAENVKVENNEEVETKTESKKDAEASAEDKFNELNDRYLRLHAEFDNFRRRTSKERIDLIGSASSGVLKDLLPVLDDFERAIDSNKEASEVESVKEGFNLIYTKFKGILNSKGLKVMSTNGETFDSEIHEAIANIPAPSKKMKGKVIEDIEKGYYLNDKVIRFAKVVVGQ